MAATTTTTTSTAPAAPAAATTTAAPAAAPTPDMEIGPAAPLTPEQAENLRAQNLQLVAEGERQKARIRELETRGRERSDRPARDDRRPDPEPRMRVVAEPPAPPPPPSHGDHPARAAAPQEDNNNNNRLLAILGVVGVVLIFGILGGQNGWFKPGVAGLGGGSAGTGSGAPTVGSTLPKDMVPGEWYATGNNKIVPSGTAVDTSPKPCTRNGVEGLCGFKKRGT